MSLVKWIKLNLLVMFIILVIPWYTNIWKHLQIVFWNIHDPAITHILRTPSGDQFWYQNPDSAYDGLVPASIKSYGYHINNSNDNSSIKHILSAKVPQMYIVEPISFRIVKHGVIGCSNTGYYVIDTNYRQVYANMDQWAWKAKLEQMGVSTNIKCYPFPLRKSYVQRGYLVYGP